MSFRVSRVERQIQEIASLFIVKNIQPQLNCLLSVNRVGLSADLRSGRVFFTVLDTSGSGMTDKDHHDLERFLNSQIGKVHHLVKSQMKIKNIPKLVFQWDRGYQHSIEIDQKLKQLESL